MKAAYVLSGMQAAELPSLLDDAGFLAELERLEITRTRADAAIDNVVPRDRAGSERTWPASQAFDDEAKRRAHAALERALEPGYHQQQHHHSHAHSHTLQARRVPIVAIVLVSLMGIAAGAGAAALILHDRVAQVLVQRTHALR